MKITVRVHEAEEGGYWAEVPAFPGCYTQAETMDELKANLQEAIEGWLEAQSSMPEEHEPEPNSRLMELAV